MKINKYILPALLAFSLTFPSCGDSSKGKKQEEAHEEEHEEDVVTINKQQNKVLKLKFDTLSKRNLNNFVQTTGQITVQAKNKASISFPIGANVSKVYVVQGQRVSKGDILAKLTHPDIIEIQTQYQKALSNLKFLKKDFERQELLLKNNVASGKQYQRIKASYMNIKSEVAGLTNKLSLLNIPADIVAQGTIIQNITLKSSITGTISKVNINLGKFIEPQQELFEILNTKDIHVDLKVFESEIQGIKTGNKVIFMLNNNTNDEFKAKVTSIASSVNESTRAITVHAIVQENTHKLIPGMYVSARILTKNIQEYAIHESAIVKQNNKHFVFIIDNDDHDEHNKTKNDGAIRLKMLEVKTGIKDMGYIQISFFEKQKANIQVAQNGAYYLLAEMNKSETEHVH